MQEWLSNGVIPADRMIDGFVALNTPDNPTTMQFVEVGLACNPTVTWHVGI